MATLKAIRQLMLQMAPELGSVETPASGSATTIVVARLASGTLSPQTYAGRWLLRPDAASAADRAGRLVTNYASSTGTLTHAGANYSDTTFTGESLEIHRFDPQRIDRAIAYAVRTIRLLDVDISPTTSHKVDYELFPFEWVQEPDDLLAIGHNGNPVMSRNRGFEKWNTYATLLDHWTLAGAAGTMARASGVPTGKYGVTITRAGTNVTLTQTIGLLDTGVDADSVRSETLTLVLRGVSSTASHLRAAVADGTQTVTTSYHTGGGGYEELTVEITVAATATTLTIQVQVNTTDAAATVDQCYLVRGAISDTIRRDIYHTEYLRPDDWEWGTTNVRLPERGKKSQYVFFSARPVSGFSTDRIAAGTADSDEVDVPADTAAIAALARFYRGLSSRSNEVTTRYQQLAGYWEMERQKAQEKLLTLPGEPNPGFGLQWRPAVLAPAVRR